MVSPAASLVNLPLVEPPPPVAEEPNLHTRLEHTKRSYETLGQSGHRMAMKEPDFVFPNQFNKRVDDLVHIDGLNCTFDADATMRPTIIFYLHRSIFLSKTCKRALRKIQIQRADVQQAEATLLITRTGEAALKRREREEFLSLFLRRFDAAAFAKFCGTVCCVGRKCLHTVQPWELLSGLNQVEIFHETIGETGRAMAWAPGFLSPTLFNKHVDYLSETSDMRSTVIFHLHRSMFLSKKCRGVFRLERTACSNPLQDEAYLAQRVPPTEALLKDLYASVRMLQGKNGSNGAIQAKRAEVENVNMARASILKKIEQIDEDLECPICFEDLTIRNAGTALCCFKPFHMNCDAQWYNTSTSNQRCPTCRTHTINQTPLTEAGRQKTLAVQGELVALIQNRNALKRLLGILNSVYQEQRSALTELIAQREELVYKEIPQMEAFLTLRREELIQERRAQGEFLSLFLHKFNARAFAKFLG